MTIYRYPLEVRDEQILWLPNGAEILCVQVHEGRPCLWARVYPKIAKVPCTIRTEGTNCELHPLSDASTYIGTYQINDGAWHVFDATPRS